MPDTYGLHPASPPMLWAFAIFYAPMAMTVGAWSVVYPWLLPMVFGANAAHDYCLSCGCGVGPDMHWCIHDCPPTDERQWAGGESHHFRAIAPYARGPWTTTTRAS